MPSKSPHLADASSACSWASDWGAARSSIEDRLGKAPPSRPRQQTLRLWPCNQSPVNIAVGWHRPRRCNPRPKKGAREPPKLRPRTPAAAAPELDPCSESSFSSSIQHPVFGPTPPTHREWFAPVDPVSSASVFQLNAPLAIPANGITANDAPSAVRPNDEAGRHRFLRPRVNTARWYHHPHAPLWRNCLPNISRAPHRRPLCAPLSAIFQQNHLWNEASLHVLGLHSPLHFAKCSCPPRTGLRAPNTSDLASKAKWRLPISKPPPSRSQRRFSPIRRGWSAIAIGLGWAPP